MQQTLIHPTEHQITIMRRYMAERSMPGHACRELTDWAPIAYNDGIITIPGIGPVQADKAIIPEDGYTIGYYTHGTGAPAWYITIRRHMPSNW